jgi:hypothetical protein
MNVFKWLGYDLEEFKERCVSMNTKGYRLEKKTEPIPDFQFFLDQIK